MLRAAAAKVTAEHEMLSRLDAFAGDGDHGTTMRRAMAIVEKVLGEAKPGDLSALLQDVGWGLLGVDGGATGPLLGMFFTGMVEPAAGRETLDAAGVAALFEGALASVQKQTRAQVGDKTMMDAMVPAVAALSAAAREGAGVSEALRRAADAAEQGAASTSELRARFGRAKNLGERSVGSPDPGATSISLMFRGFAEAVA